VIRSLTRVDKDVWKRSIQAEVLVPESIPFTHVLTIAFVSKASMMYAETLCRSLPHPPFSVKELLFTDSVRAPKGTIEFPRVIELGTNTPIDKNMVHFSHLHKNKCSKSLHEYVTIVVCVYAFPGTTAKLVIVPMNASQPKQYTLENTKFEKRAQYKYQMKISLDRLPVGLYQVDYYLNELRWASTLLEVLE